MNYEMVDDINNCWNFNRFWAISVYNKLIALRNRVKDQWAQIDVQLKEDLI